MRPPHTPAGWRFRAWPRRRDWFKTHPYCWTAKARPIIARVKIVLYVLVGLLLALQYPLWFGNGGILALWQLQRELTTHQTEIAQLRERNRALEAEVVDLKQGLEAIEERARNELGMIKKGETFYQIIEPPPKLGKGEIEN